MGFEPILRGYLMSRGAAQGFFSTNDVTFSQTYQIIYAYMVLIYILIKIKMVEVVQKLNYFLNTSPHIGLISIRFYFIPLYHIHSYINYIIFHYIPFLYTHILCILPTDTELWNVTYYVWNFCIKMKCHKMFFLNKVGSELKIRRSEDLQEMALREGSVF